MEIKRAQSILERLHEFRIMLRMLVLLEDCLSVAVDFHLVLEPLGNVPPAYLVVVCLLVLEPFADLEEGLYKRDLVVVCVLVGQPGSLARKAQLCLASGGAKRVDALFS